MKTTLNLSTGQYELDFYGVIHVTKNGQYGGCIEFRGGTGPTQYKWVQSAIRSACDYFKSSSLNADDVAAIKAAIHRIMKPAPIKITNEQMSMIYAGLHSGFLDTTKNGNYSDAATFNELMKLISDAMISDYDFQIVAE
jgi:hypothetical protein